LEQSSGGSSPPFRTSLAKARDPGFGCFEPRKANGWLTWRRNVVRPVENLNRLMAHDLVHLLDESSHAVRPAPNWPVWHVDGYDEVSGTLVTVLAETLNAQERWFLNHWDESGDPNSEGSPRYPRPLPPWKSVDSRQWEVPLELRPDDFVTSYAHHIGFYALYGRERGALGGGLNPALPWFGPPCWRRQRKRWSAEALVVGLRSDAVSAAIVVFHDANSLVAVVADDSAPAGSP
jgi:hypothetical protein